MRLFFLFFFFLLPLECFSFGARDEGRSLEKEEKIEFYPSLAVLPQTGNQSAQVVLQGRVYERSDEIKRKLFLKALAEALDLEEDAKDSVHFERRGSLFFQEGGEKARVALFWDLQDIFLAKSGEGGFFAGEASLAGNFEQKSYELASMPHPKTGETFKGQALFVAPEGLSIVSDIDDTVKITNVLDKKEMLKNTFLRDFKVVPGIAEYYKKILGGSGALHFVSAGPFQLSPELTAFFQKEKFPDFSLHMRPFSAGLDGMKEMFAGPEAFKEPSIAAILQRFPRRKFILVGDSGEKDPEIYAKLLPTYTGQIAAIWIRDVTGEGPESGRYQKLFKKDSRFRVFKEVSDLPEVTR